MNNDGLRLCQIVDITPYIEHIIKNISPNKRRCLCLILSVVVEWLVVIWKKRITVFSKCMNCCCFFFQSKFEQLIYPKNIRACENSSKSLHVHHKELRKLIKKLMHTYIGIIFYVWLHLLSWKKYNITQLFKVGFLMIDWLIVSGCIQYRQFFSRHITAVTINKSGQFWNCEVSLAALTRVLIRNLVTRSFGCRVYVSKALQYFNYTRTLIEEILFKVGNYYSTTLILIFSKRYPLYTYCSLV